MLIIPHGVVCEGSTLKCLYHLQRLTNCIVLSLDLVPQLLTWCVPGSTYCVCIGMSLEPQEIPILYITVAYAEIFKGDFGYVN